LRVLEERLALILKATNFAIWDWDLKENRAWNSPGNLRLLGLGDDASTRQVDIENADDAWLAQIHADDRDRVLAILREHWRSGAPYDLEYRYRRPDGRTIWIHTTGETIRAKDGTPLRMVGSNNDITARVEAELARHDAEDRLSLILENAPTPILSKDAQGRYLYANPTWLNQYGLKLDDILGKTSHDLFPKMTPIIAPRDQEVFETGSIIEFEYNEAFPEGERTFWVKKFPVLNANGRVTSIISMEIDITQRRQAEDTLRESERRLRLLADNLPALISYVDSDLHYRFINRTFEEWGKTRGATALGKPMKEVLGAPAFAELEAFARRALQGEHVKYERAMPYKGGTRVVSANMVPDFGENGVVRGFYGLASDITERKMAEDALKFTQFSLDHAADAVFWIGESGRLEYTNQSSERLLGYSKDEFAALNVWELDPNVPQADWPQIWNHIKNRGTHSFESVYRARNGTEIPVEVTTNQINFGGRHIICSFSRDISERQRSLAALRESEERFRGIIENSPSAIFLTDRRGRFRLINSQFEEWYGIAAAEVMGRTPHNIFPPALAELNDTADGKVIASETATESECVAPFADGTMHTLIAVKFPVRDGDGNIVGIGTIHRDVTEQKETDEKLRQSQKMEAIGQLTGGVAHDFNNLLAVMVGSFELIGERANGDARLAELAKRGLSAAERGGALTDRLLAFSRKQTLLPKRLDLNQLVRDMAALLSRTLGERIEVRTGGAEDLWPCYADQAQLENALLNLALNARDAMPDGGCLTIESSNLPLSEAAAAAEADVGPGDYVVLRVSDTGGGVAEEALGRVFEPFFTTKEVGKGTGLGLSMVHGFAKQSGGTVTIKSALGAGTTVTLYLPRAAAEKEKEAGDLVPSVPAGAGETILVVEDDDAVRLLAVDLLDDLGYQTIAADTGPAALAQLEGAAPISLLLTDVVLPGAMNGVMLASEVRRSSPATRIIFMTGYANDALDDYSDPEGPAHIIHKPFRRAELAAAIHGAMEATAGKNGR
jgi:PAS domain S-box-containing protein